jgi:hypothetical protein
MVIASVTRDGAVSFVSNNGSACNGTE